MNDRFIPSSPLGEGIDWGDEEPQKTKRRTRAIEFVPSSPLGSGVDWGDTAPEQRTFAQKFIEDPITKASSALGLGDKEDITEDPVAREQYLREQEAAGQRITARRKELGTDEANPAMRTWSNLASGMAGTVGSSAQFIGSETGLKWLEDFGKGAQEEAAALKPSDAGLVDDVVAGLGSVITFAVPGMGVSGTVLKSANYLLNAGKITAATAATAAKAAPWAAAAFATGLESAGVSQEAYDQGMAEHGNKELARSRAWMAGLASAPIVFVTDRLGIFGDSKGALKLLGTFMSEATQEGSQRILTNIAGYQPAGEGAAYDALIGGLAGGGIAAIQVAAEKYAERNANPDSEAKDLAIDTSRPMSPEEMFKAADVNPNIMAALSLKVNNLNEEESTLLVQKMIDDGHSELAVKIARAADTDTFVDQGERIEAEIPQLYQRIDEAVEMYMRGPQATQQQPVQQQPVDATVAPVDQTVAPGQPTAVQPNETGQGIEVAAVPPNSPDAAIDQRTTQLTEAAFPEPAPTAEAVPTPVEQTAQPAVAEQPAQPAVAGQPAVAEQPVPEKTPTLKGEPRTPVIPQEQLLGHLLTELNRVTKGQVDETSVRVGRPDLVQTAIAKAIKWAFDTDILYVESDGIRLRDGRMFQTGSFLGKNLPGVNAIVVNLKRAEGQPSVRNTIGHELTHQLEIRHPRIYKALHAAAMQRVATGGFKGYERFLNREMAAEMERLGKTMAPEEFKAYVETELGSEITAEVVGEMWEDKGFWLQAFRMAPSATFVQQMVGTVKSLLDRLQRAFTSTGYVRGVRDINAMRTAVTTAFQQWEQTENAVGTKELVEAKTGVSKAPAPLPAGVTPKAATKQRTEQAKTKAERVQKEGAEKAYGIKDEPVTETPMTRLAEGKPEPKPVNIPEKIETAPAGFQREQVLTKLYANIPVSERDLRKHPSVAKVWNRLEERRAQAIKEAKGYNAFVQEIATLVGGEAKLAPIKGSGRAMEKTWTEKNGDPEKINDLLRSTIIVKDPATVFEEVKALIESRFPEGVKFKRNGYAKGAKPSLTNYRDIFWNVKYKGMWAEVQINTQAMFNAKEFGEGHKLYEILRVFDARLEKGDKLTFAEKVQYGAAVLRSRVIYGKAFRNSSSVTSTPSSSTEVSLKGRASPLSQAKVSTQPAGLPGSKVVTGTPSTSQNRVPAGNFLASVAAIAASKGKSLQPNGTGFQRAVTEDGHTVVGTTGKLVGSPGWVTTPKQLTKLRQNLKKYFDAGQPARYWYENSSKAILDVFNGDKVAAERFVALLAIYSQDATVAANTTMALNAYYQWLNGQPIHAHYGSQDVKAKALLDKGEYWSGIKTNNFYINLMAEIDPGRISDEATMDVWMKRAFGYETEGGGFGPQQYAFMLRETQRLAKEQGWTPHQAQAAIWTGIKSESEGTQPETAGYSFADAINDRLAQISWEAQPGETVGVLPGLQTAPIEQKFEYFSAVHDVLYDKDGRDLIADKIGLPHGKQVTGYSAWKGNVGAGGQVFLPVRLEGQGAKRKVGANSAQLLNLYSALKGYILSQEAVVWHHPIYDPAKKNANGIDLTFARALSADEMRQLYQAVHDRFDTWDLAPGYTPSGARILNFTDISNVDFQAGMHDVLSTLPNGFGGSTGEVNAQAYRSDGDYISNDWEQFPDGAGYVQRFETGAQDGAAQRSDLQAWADELRSRVETVNRTFSDKYGWGEWRQPQTRSKAGQATQADQATDNVARQPAWLAERAAENGFASVDEWLAEQPEQFQQAAQQWRTENPVGFQRSIQVSPAASGEIRFMLDNDQGRMWSGITVNRSGKLTGGTDEQWQDLADAMRSDYGDLGLERTPALKRSMLSAADRIAPARPSPVVDTRKMAPDLQAEVKSGLMAMGMSAEDADAMIAQGFQRQQPIAGAKYNLPGETRTDVVQKLFQDREARVANVQQAVTSQGGKVEEASNVYRTIERFYGGSAFKLDQFKKKTVEPLLERIGAAGVELNDIAMYMYAMHAKERNDWIASINPLMPDGGSGMKNAEADKVLASFKTDPQFADIQQFANELWAISKNTQQVMLNSGMVTPGVVAGWNSRSQHYVPLQGFENLDELGQRGTGTGVGFDVRGPEARRAKGRETKAGQIVENIIFNHEKAIIRAEKNKVGKALLNFVLQNPDPVLWQVDKLQSMPQFYKSGTVNIHGLLDGEVRYLNQVVQNPDQTIVVKHYGKEYAIWVKDKAMLESLKGDGGLMSHGEEAAKGYFRAWQAVNRTLSKAWTAWNPVFTTINFTRDLVTGMIHAANIGGTKNAAKIAFDLMPMMKGIWDVERNNNENTANAKWYMQYQEDGGKTGFYVFGDMEERIRNINVLVANARKGVGVKQSAAAALKAMHAIESTVMDYNAIVENAIRVSAYKNAIEQQGMSRAEASSFAKNLTVNFNRKGQLTKNLSSLYLFFNPSVQGVARMVQAAKNNKREFAVAVGSMVAMGIFFGLLGADDKDEEGMPYWDRIPAYEKQRSLIMMTGDGNRVTVPLPYGYGYFVSLGYGIADLMRGRPTGSVAMDQVNSITQHFSPIGGGDDPMVALMPTIATPFVEQWANKRVTGQPVMPDAEKINGMPIPDSERYWGSTRGTAVQQFTEWLNEATGGTKISPGAVSVSPESVKNFVRFGTGGAGTFLTDAFESVYVSQEIDFEAAREKNLVPFLRQWYRYDNVRDDVAYYAEAKKQALTALEEFKKYQDTDRPEVLERLQRNRSVALLGSSIQGMERALRNLRLQEIAIMENKALSTEEQYRARQQLDDQKEQLLMQWNAKFYGAELESRQ